MYELSSSYVYPGTDVLINLAGIRDQETLNRFESIVTKERLSELKLTPIKGTFDLEYMKKIHQYIFADIYPFAGQLRTEDIAKGDFRFAPTQYMEPYANDLFKQLHKERNLKGLSADRFADRAAYYVAEINVIHPFREGNGRTQREFIRQLSKQAGHELDWSRVNPDRVLHASIRSKVDTKPLKNVLQDAIYPGQPFLLKDLLKQVEGMPSVYNKVQLDPATLNEEVLNHRIQNKGNTQTLHVQLKGKPHKYEIQMDPMPHLRQELKAQWIEQAAQNIKPISLDRGWER